MAASRKEPEDRGEYDKPSHRSLCWSRGGSLGARPRPRWRGRSSRLLVKKFIISHLMPVVNVPGDHRQRCQVGIILVGA